MAANLANSLLGSLLAEPRMVAWSKATIIPGYSPNEWRRDEFGNALRWRDYGDRSSEYGWEVDHIVPVSRGGTDAMSNLRALHWRTNASLGGLLG